VGLDKAGFLLKESKKRKRLAPFRKLLIELERDRWTYLAIQAEMTLEIIDARLAAKTDPPDAVQSIRY
jgi:cytochrome c-type biogenesis protein CcmH/NrfG